MHFLQHLLRTMLPIQVALDNQEFTPVPFDHVITITGNFVVTIRSNFVIAHS